jgi:hypothetical protein
MSWRLLFALVSLAAVIVMDAAATSLSAAPIAKAASSLPSAQPSHLTKAQYGCGWDYPCPPRPSYGRRSYRTPQVYIENNYGTVNVYQTPRRSYRGPSRRWWRDRYDEDRRRYNRCDGDGCRESCGLVCWYRRIRDGYCGHGCQTYREQERYERYYPADRGEDYSRPTYYERYRYWRRERYDERHRERYDDAPSVRFERPSSDERIPLRRFNGPTYP